MSGISIGQRLRRHGDPDTVWVVEAIVTRPDRHHPVAVLVDEDGDETMDVELAHLADPANFTALPE